MVAKLVLVGVTQELVGLEMVQQMEMETKSLQ
jgi:hypothetical protein